MIDEDNETFTVSLSNAVNATLGADEAMAIITDNDGDNPPPSSNLPKLAINDVTVSEDVGSAVFSVRLSGENSAAVTVAYATKDGTATVGADYTAVSGTLTFLTGGSVQTLAVPVVDDGEEEADETFTVRLSDVRNATLLDGEGRAIIIDDDGLPPAELPALSIDDVTVSEDVGSAVFSVRLSGESTATVTVAYATANGTAIAGADYRARSGTLTFLSGGTMQTLAVPVVDDGEEEGNETFTVSLSDVRNATLLDGDGRATIIDDDGDGNGTPSPSGQPALAIDDVAVGEDEGSAAFTGLSEESATAVTVAYARRDGDRRLGGRRWTLTFQPGETEHSLSVPVLEDSEEEENDLHRNLSDGDARRR